MGKIFICYRRKETADLTGRIYDRLAGHFGSDAVFMDVDTLLSGANYRDQIIAIIDQCSVLLAVVGTEWLTIRNDQGQRRLDDPDDELRIELVAALDKGLTIIPLRAHEAALPEEGQLPQELRPLAHTEPILIRSGTGFNTDIRALIERLEQLGVLPPEARFPWHYLLMLLGVACLLTGILHGLPQLTPTESYLRQQLNPKVALGDLDPSMAPSMPDTWYNLGRFRQEWIRYLGWACLPLGLGPLLIVFGKRLCCVHQDQIATRTHYAWGSGRLPTPKSGKAVLCLALGMASIGWGLLSAIPALILGGLAYLDIRRQPTWIRGRSLILVGSLFALLGAAISTDQFVTLWRLDRWLVAMEEAYRLDQAGQSTEAERAAGRAIDCDLASPLAAAASHLRRAQIRVRQSNLEQALADANRALEQFEAFRDRHQYFSPVEDQALQQAETLRSELLEQLGHPAGDRRPPAEEREADPLENDPDEMAPTPPAPMADPSA